MWSGLGLDKVKEAWSTLEQSLDEAVGHPLGSGPGQPSFSPINIPPPSRLSSGLPLGAGSASATPRDKSASPPPTAENDVDSSSGLGRVRRVSRDFFDSLINAGSRSTTPVAPPRKSSYRWRM